MAGFTLDESRLAHVAGRYEIETDHDALIALESVILGDGDNGPLLAGPCEIAVDLLADADGELDGYRIILHPAAGETAPWLASGIQRVSYHRDAGHDTAGIIRDFVRVANSLLAWHQQPGQGEAAQPPADDDDDRMTRAINDGIDFVTGQLDLGERDADPREGHRQRHRHRMGPPGAVPFTWPEFIAEETWSADPGEKEDRRHGGTGDRTDPGQCASNAAMAIVGYPGPRRASSPGEGRSGGDGRKGSGERGRGGHGGMAGGVQGGREPPARRRDPPAGRLAARSRPREVHPADQCPYPERGEPGKVHVHIDNSAGSPATGTYDPGDLVLAARKA